MCDCNLFDGKNFNLKRYAKYVIEGNIEEKQLIFFDNNTRSCFLDLKKCVSATYKFNTYYFLNFKKTNAMFSTAFKYNNKIVSVSLFETLFISVDGVLICEENVENLNYSHFEIFKDFCLIYFTGKRNYFVALKDNEIKVATYYDECNVNKDEKIFMCKMNDSLNHGLVYQIKDDVSNYLVYLDDEEMKLKTGFLALVFLDCVKAKNFSYCNSLLSDELKMKNVENIKEFFVPFDWFYPIDEKTMILINKNTLAGIYEFEYKDNLIFNITKC